MPILPLSLPTRTAGSSAGYADDRNTIIQKINELALTMAISPLSIIAAVGAGNPAADTNAMVVKINELIGLSNGGGTTTPTTLAITSIDPTSAKAGDTIILTGTGFTGALNVLFAGVAVGSGKFQVLSATQITVTVPSISAGSNPVQVVGATATSAARAFIVQAAAANVIPVASASQPAAITLPASQVALAGSGTDSDGTVTGYAWRQVTGPINAVGLPATTQNVVASGLTTAGTYQFGFKVQDDKGAYSNEQFVNVVVNAAGASPKQHLLVALGNSQTYGPPFGGPSTTTPPGKGADSWPDKVAANTAYLVRNEGRDGNSWSDLRDRAQGIITYFTSTKASDYLSRVLTLQEATNTAWHQNKVGEASAADAKALVDFLRAGLPSDVKIWLFASYPFNSNADGIDGVRIDNLVTGFNEIALNIDTAKSASIGLYAAVDKVLNPRTHPVLANASAALDKTYWVDGIHLYGTGNAIIADLVVKAFGTADKIVNAVGTAAGFPYGTPYLGTPNYVPFKSYEPPIHGDNPTGQIQYCSTTDAQCKGTFSLGMSIRYPFDKFTTSEFATIPGVLKIYIQNGENPERLAATVTVDPQKTKKGEVIFEDHPNGGYSTWRVEVVTDYFTFDDQSVSYWT